MGVLYRFTRSAWQPAADVCRTAEGLLVVVEAYGCPPRGLHVTVDRQRVVVAGKRERPVGPARWLRGEIAWGPFEPALVLPEPADPAGARAELRDGLLIVRCPAGAPVAHTMRIMVEAIG